MRLPPFFLTIVFLGLFSMVGWGWALWQFAPRWLDAAPPGAKEPPPKPAQTPPGPITGNLRLIAESPLPPTLLEVRINEKSFLLLDKTGVDLDLEEEWTYPPEGLTVSLRAEWTDYLPGPRAVRVRAFFDGVLISDTIAWGRDEAVTKSWHLPGAADLLEAAEALAPPLLPPPAPGQSDPALPAPPGLAGKKQAAGEPTETAPQIFAVPSPAE